MSLLNDFQLPRCEAWIKESCQDVYDDVGCKAAMSFCDAEIDAPFSSLGLFAVSLAAAIDSLVQIFKDLASMI